MKKKREMYGASTLAATRKGVTERNWVVEDLTRKLAQARARGDKKAAAKIHKDLHYWKQTRDEALALLEELASW